MTHEELLPIINSERAAVQTLQEKLTNSNAPALKWQCEQALQDLGEAERYSQPPSPVWEIVNVAVEYAKNGRRVVEDAVNKGGYEVEEIYPKSSI